VPFSLFKPVVDGDGAIVDLRWDYANTAASTAIGRGESDLVGRTLREVLPGIWERQGPFHNSTRALREQITVEFEWSYDHNGLRRWFQVIASPCDDGLAMWFSNVTRRKRQHEALQEADRRKDEFLATLAHELRNPLAPIRQAALIARSPAATQAQLHWSLEIIERQVAHMALLLDDLLDVSRITRGKLELRKTVTDLGQIAETALETARPIIDQRQQRLVLDWSADRARALWAMVDSMRISQVLSNLLANASKYTPIEGEIHLSARREGDDAVIEISDNGIGIAPESLEQIFEMFTQVRRAKSAPSMGLGIGLALSRGIVALHGGTLTARSEGPDRGSTFTLRLALCESPEDATLPGIPVRQVVKPRRVLVADDNRDAAESLAEILRMEGHEVALAFDGESALRQFNRITPDVALLDIGMPRMSGNEVAIAIRSSPGGERPMLVAITGWGQERDRDAAKKAGFDFHFTKPIDPDQVLRLMGDAKATLESTRDAP
jgi:signal transduction histidine kinase/CheY-like chemotaxis protein